MNPITAIVLAAGSGTRMKSELPKILHPVAGFPLVYYPLNLLKNLRVKKTILVAGKNNLPVRDFITENKFKNIRIAVQNRPLGTAHAVMSTLVGEKSAVKTNYLVLYGDMPLVRSETVSELTRVHREKNSELTFVTAVMNNPPAYGRVQRTSGGNPHSIVEFGDATEAQKKITEVNLGIYLINGAFLKEGLKKIKSKNRQNEFYLTDLVKLAFDEGRVVATVYAEDSSEGLGVNTQEELAHVQKMVMGRHLCSLMKEGVCCVNPEGIIIDLEVNVGRGSRIFGPSFLFGKTKIGKDCTIEAGAWIKDAVIGDGVTIKAFSCIEESVVGRSAQIGPFAHLRPGSKIGPDCRVGNFVETKKSNIGEKTKINHLSYIGDAHVGKKVNIGAGTITCNYDGVKKYKTMIEDKVFVGSDVQFVAPVRIGKGAYIGAGSTITGNVSPASLALSRAPQNEVKNWAKKRGNSK